MRRDPPRATGTAALDARCRLGCGSPRLHLYECLCPHLCHHHRCYAFRSIQHARHILRYFDLGLSWLIGTTAQETLGAIIFLFIKHPYDVGDRVDVGDDQYIVKEMRLLTTVFKTTNGKNVMISHSQLATKPIVNLRRSGAIEETFKFEVAYSTTFAQIEALRTKMVHWIEGEKRDFLPGLDINVVDFQEQGSLLLSAAFVTNPTGSRAAEGTATQPMALSTQGLDGRVQDLRPKGDPTSLRSTTSPQYLTRPLTRRSPLPPPKLVSRTRWVQVTDRTASWMRALPLVVTTYLTTFQARLLQLLAQLHLRAPCRQPMRSSKADCETPPACPLRRLVLLRLT